MGPFVKICGVASPEDARAVSALAPDAMGFIFAAVSKRCVTPEAVKPWAASVPDSILKVGVFVDASYDEIMRAMETAGLDVVQLHGSEPPELAARIPLRVWKAIHVGRVAGETVDAYPVDAFLVDSYSPDSPGGTGRTGDWQTARDFVQARRKPVLLAGGLTPENVREAIRTVSPWGVDVSSGVEAAPGRKDIERVRDFIEQCRSC